MLKLHPDSHVDHVSPEIIRLLLDLYKDRENPDRKTLVDAIPLPENMMLGCWLRGPMVGDDPITEDMVKYKVREGRTHHSRMIDRPPVATRLLTVVMGPSDQGDPLVLYTCYPGPPARKELDDPRMTTAEFEEAKAFWAVHALCDWPSQEGEI